jgi:hypothetical protein
MRSAFFPGLLRGGEEVRSVVAAVTIAVVTKNAGIQFPAVFAWPEFIQYIYQVDIVTGNEMRNG